jgi:4-diphosphocytidyl-2-C-methyl-D-erythritol kinase
MLLRAPAKINLTLEVLDRRADGFHGLRSLMVPLELADEIEVNPSPEGFAFTCDDPTISQEKNLVVWALAALGPRERNFSIALRKRIPIQAGLGGGSSDAAAVLLAAIEGHFGEVRDRDWIAVARALGSDVAFFLARTGALVEGAGERVTAIGALPPWHVLIVKPPANVSTAAAYAEMDQHARPSRPRNTSLTLRALAALQAGDFESVATCLSNDFHDVVRAIEPSVATALDALRAAGARHVLLAGSGSCVFALTQTATERDAIAQHLALLPEYRVFATRFASSDAAWRAEQRA